MIAYPFQPTRAGKKVKFYSAKIQLDGWPKIRVFALRTTDRGIAKEKIRKMVLEFEREEMGLLPPRLEREAAKTPVSGLLDAFLADLQGQNRSRNTVRRYRRVLRAAFKLAGWSYLRDITPANFTRFRSTCGRSANWTNGLLGVLLTWLNWLVRSGSLPANPLAGVVPARVVKKEYRRALSPEEFQRLVSAAPVERAAMYLFLGYTGIRRDEANKLRWGNFEGIDGETPAVVLPAEITKNRKQDTILLRPEALLALEQLRPEMAMPYEWALRGKVPSPRKLREDLAAAGIPFLDDRGRRMDIHALRKTYITLGAAVVSSPQVLKQMARHSDLRTTLDHYTDGQKLPMKEALAALPSISLSHEKRAQKRTHAGVISAFNSAFSVTLCHFLAEYRDSVSVALASANGDYFASCHDLKMVGVARFEIFGPILLGAYKQQ